jgi:dTDP-4-dehydrorhamnose 3,5-epimerase
MRFSPTIIPQLFLLDLEPRVDERGFFARIWSGNELAGQHLNDSCQQVSLAYNARRGTLRGMHYQSEPHAEAKMVRAIRGAIHDVVLDLRSESPTFEKWIVAELSAENRQALFVPEGCAHGYITLTDETEVLYVHSGLQQPQAERGIHWDSPVLRGAWPCSPTIISERDQRLPVAVFP